MKNGHQIRVHVFFTLFCVPVLFINVFPQTITRVEVLVAYTPAAAQETVDIAGTILSAFHETNDSYSFSGINIRLVPVYIMQVDYQESNSVDVDCDRFCATSDGYMDEIHYYRDLYGADVCVLITHHDGQAGGKAKAIGADATTAFCVVDESIATVVYGFAHEIGHLQGALHDRAHTQQQDGYNHGFVYAPGNWKTIMAGGSYTTLGAWSNPYKDYYGAQMGTVESEDNHRQLNENASTISAFRSSSNLYVPEDGSFSSVLAIVSSGETVVVNGYQVVTGIRQFQVE